MNPLIDVIPEKYRKVVYFLATLLVAAYGVFQATDGNWGQVIGSVLIALTTGVATANTAVVTNELPVDPYDGSYVDAVAQVDEGARFVVDSDGAATDERS